jgi:hypothetical protein
MSDAAADDAMARVARDLADALRDYARERRDEHRLRVAELQTQLCATRRAEMAAVVLAPE